MENNDRDLLQEVRNWKAIALWLADCHAATATYDGELRSCSASRRKRFRDICKTAADCLMCEAPINIRTDYLNEKHLSNVYERCRDAAKE